MFGSMGNMFGLLGNLNKITKEYKANMEKLKDEKVQASVGGDQVVATVNGIGELVEIKIAPELVKDGDAEIIEELVISAVNSAVEKSRQLAQAQMGQIAEMLPMGQLKDLLGQLPKDTTAG